MDPYWPCHPKQAAAETMMVVHPYAQDCASVIVIDCGHDHGQAIAVTDWWPVVSRVHLQHPATTSRGDDVVWMMNYPSQRRRPLQLIVQTRLV